MDLQNSDMIQEVRNCFSNAIVLPSDESVWEWAEGINFKIPGSLRSSRFNADITPWLKYPAERVVDPKTKVLTLLGPVQGAKSTLGELTFAYWIKNDPGSILYNWESDLKIRPIWDERIEPIFEKNPEVFEEKWPTNKSKAKQCNVVFNDGYFFRMQGVNATGNRQSRSVRFLINEEVKDWPKGTYSDVCKRVTAAWNSFVLNLSPASYWDSETKTGDELFTVYSEGTQDEYWVPCSKCDQYQWMGFDSVSNKPGGLKWDSSDKVRLASGRFDWQKLSKTIRWECSYCGHEHFDDVRVRRTLSEEGCYKQQNDGAADGIVSCKYNALNVYWIPFLDLVKEFYSAIADSKRGRLELLEDFTQKRKVDFFDRNDRPVENQLVLAEGLRLHEGIENADVRLMAVDKQKDHFWVVIRDWKRLSGDPKHWVWTRLVWEGHVPEEADVEGLRLDHNLQPRFVWVDSGYKAKEVYRMCGRYGYIAIKGEDSSYYNHTVQYKDRGVSKNRRTREIYSEPTEIDVFEGTANCGRTFCQLIRYSKQSIRDRLAWLRSDSSVLYEIPEDVSSDYELHNDSETLKDFQIPKTGEIVKIWYQMRKRNDLFVCEAYQVLMAEILGLLGGDLDILDRGNLPKEKRIYG